MTSRRSTPSDQAELRRFTLLARLWVLAIIIVATALGVVGASGLAVGAIAIGLIGHVVVFDARRPWWRSEPRAAVVSRRATLAVAILLVLVTAVVIYVQLGRP